MTTNHHCLGYTPLETLWGNDNKEYGFYSLNQKITRALAARDHLGYDPKATRWDKNLDDYGYYSINGGIVRALQDLSGRS
jgi:hypothetical protein